MYTSWFRLKENVWNNSFAYDIRKQNNPDPQIYVTNIIEWTLDDIQVWDKIVFEEIDSRWQIQSFVWLKNFVKLTNSHSGPTPLVVLGLQPESNNERKKNIYIIDNHNHALFFRYQELFNWNISKWIDLIHIDQHTDMNNNPNVIASPPRWTKQSYSLQDIFHFTNYQCNVWNFIQPAIQDWLISEVIQINTEYSLLNNYRHCEKWNDSLSRNGGKAILNQKKIATPTARNDSDFILDIDLDFRHPNMWIEEYKQSIQITKNLISQASLVTIATSPYFLDQTLAIKILKDIFN